MSNIGMMDGAFFVGRKEIVDWINQTLNVNLTKVEQTASGAIACQLLDAMHPDQVPMHKVNWSAKQDFEFIQNYKILQTCFTKLSIDRHVDVDRLIKGRYQDNLEFMQWFKRFFEMGTNPENREYDALARRSRGKGGAQYPYNCSGSATRQATSSKSNGRIAAPPTRVKTTVQRTGSSSERPTKPSSQSSAPSSAPSPATLSPEDNSALTQALQTVGHLQGEIERLQNVNDELQTEMNGIEKERDFYFDKLRDIEMMLQDIEDSGKGTELSSKIFEILYATAEGFQPAEEVVPLATDAVMEPSLEAEEEEEDETY